MIDIKRWRDFCWSKDHILILYGSNKTIEISNVFTDVGCYYYNCESGQISFNGFNAQTVSTISLSTLAIFDQPLDVIILVGIDFPKINFLARTMKDFSQEVNFYVGGKSEYFQYHGCKYLYSKAQLINSEVENSFADLSIPLYDYLSRIDLEQEKVRGKCIVDRYHNICLEDFIGVYTNHRYGKRVTCYQGGPYKSKLHMFGASTLYGVGVEDKDTITSLLQKKLNKHGKFIQVINHGICGYVMDGLLNRISRLGLAYGDIVVWGLSFSLIWNYENITLSAFLYILNEVKNRCASFGARFICLNQPSIYDLNVRTELENNYYQFVDVKQDKIASPKLKYKLISALKKNRIDYIDPINMFQQPRRYTEVFLDDVHYLPSGNQLIADSIYNDFHHNVIVQDRFGMTIGKGEGEEEYRFKNILIKKYESNLRDYLRSIKTRPISPQAVIGSVNLNANPFTNGHLHLVKYAAQQVDWLYVFVIEEDASYFSFQERYKLVCENLQNYDNILVNPSGYLMTSKVTFPEYFNKENMQNKDVNCDKDLLYFASQIALALGISKRFIGEEPYCNITKQHNERMKQILPLYNIDVVEVKRLKYENGYISASHVRQLYRENHMLELKKMVPDITYEFLKNRKNK